MLIQQRGHMSCLSYFMPTGHGQMKAQEPRKHAKRVKSAKVRKLYEGRFSTHTSMCKRMEKSKIGWEILKVQEYFYHFYYFYYVHPGPSIISISFQSMFFFQSNLFQNPLWDPRTGRLVRRDLVRSGDTLRVKRIEMRKEIRWIETNSEHIEYFNIMISQHPGNTPRPLHTYA